MTFARRSLARFPFSKSSSLRGRRPSRARQPSLGPGRRTRSGCCSRPRWSAANAAGSAAGDGDSDFSGVSSVLASRRWLRRIRLRPTSAPSGTRLVFASDTTDLVGSLGGTNGSSNVYVRDTATGQTILVSATPGGQPGNGDSDDPVISPDGRYVAFLGPATQLSPRFNASSDDLTDPSTALPLRHATSRRARPRCSTRRPDGQASDGGGTGVFVFSPDSQSLRLHRHLGRPDDRAGRSQLELRRVLSGLGPVEPAAVRVCPGPRGTDHRAGKRLDGGSGLRRQTRSIPATRRASSSFSPDSHSLVFASGTPRPT